MEKTDWLQRMTEIFGPDDPVKITEYCRKNWPEYVEHVFRTAEDACGNKFLFDYEWDMERTWEHEHFQGEIDWSRIPSGDREFLWQFNRHRFLMCLGQAWQMSSDEKYAWHYVRLLRDWIDRAEPGENAGLGPWRTLETGIRAEIWLRSLPLILGCRAADAGFLEKVYGSLKKHQKRLMENFQPHKYISNWGVLESCGLMLLSLALPDSESCLKEAVRRLKDAASIQVLEDGMQWEQSPMYHNEVYHCFLTALYYGERAGIEMPGLIRETVKKMAYVDLKWKRPDHTQFAQGDSDASDLRDQISAGAVILGDGTLKSGGYELLDYENAWLFGYRGCEEYSKLTARRPDFLSASLPFGGNYYFRSGWEGKANLLHFRCGETGGGHGHADKLHVDLVICGEDLLVDSGRYTYVDGPERSRFKEAAAHNVILADGRGFAECETSWIYKNLCTCIKQQYYEGRLGAFVEGSHLGYWEDGILINRKIIWIKPDIYVIADDIFGRGPHSYESFWHFGGQGSVKLSGDMIHFMGDEMEAYLQSAKSISGATEETELQASEESYYYNEKHGNTVCRIRAKAGGFYRRITVVNGGRKGSTEPVRIESLPLYSAVHECCLDKSLAEALRIEDGKREYVLFIIHREVLTPTDILQWENCLGYGKIVLFDRTEEKSEVITGEALAW
ncbi:alginate lyase family protein [Murimonas intestini]|uniref:alginate lyase family protein n=1 Tax=Murimonas intestini TaxID=1337051 RepID=UPI0011DDFDDB|nr:alginate lyase family protein [Murimonas intestini]